MGSHILTLSSLYAAEKTDIEILCTELKKLDKNEQMVPWDLLIRS